MGRRASRLGRPPHLWLSLCKHSCSSAALSVPGLSPVGRREGFLGLPGFRAQGCHLSSLAAQGLLDQINPPRNSQVNSRCCPFAIESGDPWLFSKCQGTLGCFPDSDLLCLLAQISLVGVWEWVRGEPRLTYLCVHLQSYLPGPAVRWEVSSLEMGLGNQRPQ